MPPYVRSHQWPRELLDRWRGTVLAAWSPRRMTVVDLGGGRLRCRAALLLAAVRGARGRVQQRIGRYVRGQVRGQIAGVIAKVVTAVPANRGRVRVEAGVDQEHDAHVPVTAAACSLHRADLLGLAGEERIGENVDEFLVPHNDI